MEEEILSVETQEVAEPVEDVVETSEQTQEVAEPEPQQEAEQPKVEERDYERDAAFANMRRSMEQAQKEKEETQKLFEAMKADKERLAKAFGMYGFNGDVDEIEDQAKAHYSGKTVEEVRNERLQAQKVFEEQQRREQETLAKDNQIKDLQRQLYARILSDDLKTIQAKDPSIKSLDDLGKDFALMRSTGVSIDVAYNAVKSTLEANKKTPPPEIGKVNATQKADKTYYTSAEVSPVQNHLFRIGIKPGKAAASKGIAVVKTGKPERLTFAEGWHDIAMSPDCGNFVDSWSNLTTPRVIDLCSADGKKRTNLLTAADPTSAYAYTEISLGTVKSADGKYDNYYRLIKPLNFDPTKKYPMIVYVYGGPHSQMVKDTYLAELRRLEMNFAQKGYLVYVQDNRGTQNRGLEFEQAIHGQCGQAEMADQMVGVRMMMELPFVDKERIGVHGWSYGGFMTISLITNYPDVFKVGVAGGPVIDWKWYEVMYGERYMDNPATNPEGYAKTSLINKAKDLKGKLLICQGAIDPVVVWEHSLSFVRECVKNNVQVDYFPYPCHEHNVSGKDRVHLNDKIVLYFEDYL
jgi:dienelactone hydrolase